MADGTPQPEAVVRAFIDAWNRMDFDAIVASLDTDVVYHNIPMQPIAGRDAVRDYLRGVWRFDAVNWRLHNIAANGSTILTERSDDFVIDGCPVSLPVMGTFEIRGGCITAWRDYFDLASYKEQLKRCEPQGPESAA